MAKNFYNLDEVLSIPIEEVCNAYGIKIGRGGMCSIRPDDNDPSCKLYTNNSNGFDTFYDFGVHIGGNVINLVMFLSNTDRQGAFDILGEMFNLMPLNNTDYERRFELTNSQYEKIGVYGDLATKNLDIDLEKYSVESAKKYSDKYHMSVNELRKEHPDFYTYKILLNRALPFVSEMRNNYYCELYNHYRLSKIMKVSETATMTEAAFKKFEEIKNKLVIAEKLLHKAAKGTSFEEKLNYQKYDIMEDFRSIVDGKLSFQIGPVPYNDVKQEARNNDEVIHYRSISEEDYIDLANNFLNDVPHAAFIRGDKVNLAFLPKYSSAMEKNIETLKVKQQIEVAVSRETAVADEKTQNRSACELER